MATTSLFDLAILDRADQYTGLIEDVTTLPKEFETIPVHKRAGFYYYTAKRTGLPPVQFRNVNAGVASSKSNYKQEIKQMMPIDGRVEMDEMVFDADPGTVGNLFQLEVAGLIRSAAITLGVQTWYGTSADSSGFVGLRSQLADTVQASTGTGAITTSAYLISLDPKEGVRFDVGQNGDFAVSTPVRLLLPDANNSSLSLFKWVANLKAWIGLNAMSNLSAWAVTGVSNASAAAWLTDDKANQLWAKIPVARRHNLCWYMNRFAHSYLQRSRSTINLGIPGGLTAASYQTASAAGTPAFAEPPDRLAGYPIHVSDSIINTETN